MSFEYLPLETLEDLDGDTEIAITIRHPSDGKASIRRCLVSDFAILLAASDVKESGETKALHRSESVFTKYTAVEGGSIEPTAFNRVFRTSVTITNVVRSHQEAQEWQNRVEGLVAQARAKQGKAA